VRYADIYEYRAQIFDVIQVNDNVLISIFIYILKWRLKINSLRFKSATWICTLTTVVS
jgi:hypothetical protein